MLSLVHQPPDSVCPGGILADEMGLGKTAQVAIFLKRWFAERREARKNALAEKKKKENANNSSTSNTNDHTDHTNQSTDTDATLGITPLSILLIVPKNLVKHWTDELLKWYILIYMKLLI